MALEWVCIYIYVYICPFTFFIYTHKLNNARIPIKSYPMLNTNMQVAEG